MLDDAYACRGRGDGLEIANGTASRKENDGDDGASDGASGTASESMIGGGAAKLVSRKITWCPDYLNR